MQHRKPDATSPIQADELEKKAVHDFLQSSKSLIEIRKIFLFLTNTTSDQPLRRELNNTLALIENANTFNALLQVTEPMNLERDQPYDARSRLLGIPGIKAMLWFDAFWTNHANARYQLRLFREEIINNMAKLGCYSLDTVSPEKPGM